MPLFFMIVDIGSLGILLRTSANFSGMPLQPPERVFPDAQWQDLQALLEALTEQQRHWLRDYLDGGSAAPVQASATPVAASLTIAFGTETNNCRQLAETLARRCRETGIPADVVDLATLRVRRLTRTAHLAVITATHGDGDPPEPITDFYDELMDDGAPGLGDLRFGVLALGDSSYERFCATGQRIDERLAALGGTRLIARRDCDVDFEEPAHAWMTELLARLPRGAACTSAATAAAPTVPLAEFGKTHPAVVEVLGNRNLSHPGRPDPIHHVELALPSAGFVLEPGDAIGVIPENPPELVAAVLDCTGLSGEQPVRVRNEALSLVEALRLHRDLVIPGQALVQLLARLADSRELAAVLAADVRTQRSFLQQWQVRDLLAIVPVHPEPQALIDALRPLQPRLYDVANCLSAGDDELHLTVVAYRYRFRDREEDGVASRYLQELQPGDRVAVYPHRNVRFRLPDNARAPLILVAEGTGIAPYRAFLQSLGHRRAPPPCWLTIAERSFEDDFLYQLDLQQALTSGLLTRLDTVFHGDRADRCLADPLLENLVQIADWIAADGHLYLCGDKTTLEACESRLEHALDDLRGRGYWKSLGKDKRIHRNLY
jgi:sulfite reductase (NADPH) flavoprotein alpha-component